MSENKPEYPLGPVQTKASEVLGTNVVSILRETLTAELSESEIRTLRKNLSQLVDGSRHEAAEIEQPRTYDTDGHSMEGMGTASFISNETTPEVARIAWASGRRKGYLNGVADTIGYIISLSYTKPR